MLRGSFSTVYEHHKYALFVFIPFYWLSAHPLKVGFICKEEYL